MKKTLLTLMIVTTICSLSGCNEKTQPAATETSNTSISQPIKQDSTNTEPTQSSRMITDIAGNEIEIPPVSEIEHVVIITPPVTSVLLDVIPNNQMIVGLNPKAFVYSNANVMELLFPIYKDIDTTFVGEDFSINTEALLQLHPDIILYYGDVQQKGLENIELPIINFCSPGLTDPKEVTIAWDNLLRDIFDVEKSQGLQAEWEYFDGKTLDILSAQTSDPKRALWVFSNMSGRVVVAGGSSFDAYAESFFEKAGIENVATGIQGTAEVDMEQIYEWNPDIIFVFHNVSAKSYLNNTIDGQDWSLLRAWDNKAIFDIPQTAYSWGAPCADSPLMPLWLISKAYPDLLSENDFRRELVGYYERIHNIALTNDDLDSILSLREIQ